MTPDLIQFLKLFSLTFLAFMELLIVFLLLAIVKRFRDQEKLEKKLATESLKEEVN